MVKLYEFQKGIFRSDGTVEIKKYKSLLHNVYMIR